MQERGESVELELCALEEPLHSTQCGLGVLLVVAFAVWRRANLHNAALAQEGKHLRGRDGQLLLLAIVDKALHSTNDLWGHGHARGEAGGAPAVVAHAHAGDLLQTGAGHGKQQQASSTRCSSRVIVVRFKVWLRLTKCV